MNLITRLTTIAISSVIIAILLIPNGLVTQSSAIQPVMDQEKNFIELSLPTASDYVEDTIGDMKIRTVFSFHGGVETVDSFRIFDQLGGYQENTPIMFQLLGGVGPDKPLLYTVTDGALSKQLAGRTSAPQYFNFDVDVYLFKRGNEIAFRHIQYNNCDVKDYYITTLHDGDETFSGQTKFTIADAFTFTCGGYHLYCPSCIAVEVLERNPNVVSSLDLPDSYTTWEDLFIELGIHK